MEKWIRNTFQIVENGWDNGDETFQDAFSFNNGDDLIKAPVSWFADRFGGVQAPPTVSMLRASDPDDVLGWHAHFDAWKDQGIIS